MLFTSLVQANLKTGFIGQEIEYYTRLDSTNKEAWEIIKDGAKPGTIVITDNQFRGKGRRNRQWMASPDKSLTFSVILSPNIKANISGWLPILSGLAVQKALRQFDLSIQLKWPNDLLLNGKKVGGILCESKVIGSILESAIIGIGLNVNETMDDIDASLHSTSTSLHIATDKFYQRERVLAEILNALEKLIDGLPDITRKVKSEWEVACSHMDKKVQFHHGDETVSGIFKSLGESGSAILNINGNESKFYSGEIDTSVPI